MFTITCLNMHPKCTTVKSNTTDSTSFELFTCELLFHSLRKICCYFFVFLVNVALSLSIYLSQCVCMSHFQVDWNKLTFNFVAFFLFVFFDKLHKQKIHNKYFVPRASKLHAIHTKPYENWCRPIYYWLLSPDKLIQQCNVVCWPIHQCLFPVVLWGVVGWFIFLFRLFSFFFSFVLFQSLEFIFVTV